MNEREQTMTQGTPEKSDDTSLWGYVSGRISVLETQLMNRAFFESLARSRTFGDAQSLLSKTPYRLYFTTNETVNDYSLTLDLAFQRMIDGILKDAPAHPMEFYFHASDRYVYFRNLYIRLSTRNVSAPELENTFEALAETADEQGAVSGHRQMVANREAPGQNNPVARSLFLDSVLTTLKLQLSSSIGEELIQRVFRDTTLLEGWTAMLRSRWNGTDPDVIQAWFIVPDEYKEFVRNTSLLALTNPVQALQGYVSDTALNALAGITVESLRQNLDNHVRDAVRENILACRMFPYGPEKLLSYYLALKIENENLRLALSSVVSGIESRIVMERFRREYA